MMMIVDGSITIKQYNMNKIVIFDLDGTLDIIDDRRKVYTKPNRKMDWDKF